MKKLNKSEIEAVANKIQSEVQQVIEEKLKVKNDKLLSDFYKTSSGKAIKLVNKNYPGTVYEHTINKIVGVKRPYSLIPRISAIKQELIIGQIDTPDITKLIESVKTKFIS